jgi:hypothetical protein
VNEYGLFVATRGHAPPSGPFYTLKHREFFLRPNDILLRDKGGEESVQDFGDLQITDPNFKATNSFTHLWDEQGTGASVQASVHRPNVPEGHVFFGDAFVGGSRGSPSTHALIAPDNEKMFAKPTDWVRKWKQKKGKIKLYVWRAVVPENFVALGDVVTTREKEKPDLDAYRAVHIGLCVTKLTLGPGLRTDPERPGDQAMIWDDKGAWGWDTSDCAAFRSFDGTFFMGIDATYDPPPGPYYAISSDYVPAASRFIARATQDYASDDEKTFFSFKKGEYFVITYYEADNPWWTGYPHGRPKTARKTVASTFVEKVETRLCNSMSSWPEGGQEVKQPALTFSKGDQIIVTNSEGVDVRTGFWEGYTAQEPDKMGFFPARCVA